MIGDYNNYNLFKQPEFWRKLKYIKYVTPKSSFDRDASTWPPDGYWGCVDCGTVKDGMLMARWIPFSAMDKQDLLAGKRLPQGSCKECETLREETLRERGEIL